MKKYLFSILGIAMLLAFSACEKDRAFVEFNDLEKGAYARKLSVTGSYFLTDIPGAIIDVSVEFYDENQGKNVTDYNWQVQYIDKVKNDTNSIGLTDILNIPSSSFGTNAETGLPSADFSFTLTRVMEVFGLTEETIDVGNTFRFFATIKTVSGQTFTAANTGNSLVGSAPISAFFSFDADLLCPSDLAGVLTTTTVPWCGGESDPKIVEWVATDDAGIYDVVNPDSPEDRASADFSYGAYDVCYGGPPYPNGASGTLLVKDVCNVLSPIGASQWAEAYWYNSVTVDGSTLIIDWENDFGESGVSTLVRQDGADWPPLTN